MILSIRSDNPQAELGLFDKDGKQIDYLTWQGHRLLAETIHQKLQELLAKNKLELKDLTGIVGYIGPGSFTGLRIGLSVANALAYAYDLQAAGSAGENWLQNAIKQLPQNPKGHLILPIYDSPAVNS